MERSSPVYPSTPITPARAPGPCGDYSPSSSSSLPPRRPLPRTVVRACRAPPSQTPSATWQSSKRTRTGARPRGSRRKEGVRAASRSTTLRRSAGATACACVPPRSSATTSLPGPGAATTCAAFGRPRRAARTSAPTSPGRSPWRATRSMRCSPRAAPTSGTLANDARRSGRRRTRGAVATPRAQQQRRPGRRRPCRRPPRGCRRIIRRLLPDPRRRVLVPAPRQRRPTHPRPCRARCTPPHVPARARRRRRWRCWRRTRFRR